MSDEPALRYALRKMWGNGGRRVLTAALYAMASLVILAAAFIYRAAQPEPPVPYNPIRYELQHVQTSDPVTGIVSVPHLPGVAGPAVRVGDIVPIHAEVCNRDSMPVTVTGWAEWVSVDPLGYHHRIFDTTATIKPGCVVRDFANRMPPEVVADIRGEAATGHTTMTWRLGGYVTPTAPNGVTAVWTTETFTVIAP